MPIITHLKKDCISCGACVVIAPEFWEMDAQGLAQLKESIQRGDTWVRAIDEKDKPTNKEAEECCPVNIIHVDE